MTTLTTAQKAAQTRAANKAAQADALVIANKSLSYSQDTGVLFMNDRRRNDSDPTMSGRFNYKGQPAYIAGWKRVQNGQPFMSFSITHAVTRETLAQGRFAPNTECDIARNHPSSVGSLAKTNERVAVWKKAPEGKQAYLFVTIEFSSIIDHTNAMDDF